MAYIPYVLLALQGGTGLRASGTIGNVLTSDGSGGWVSSPPATSGTVTAVTGTANRISSTGGTTPQIDIDAAYVGQTSITTLGTVSTGTWSATTIATTKGGTGLTTYTTGDLLYASASNVLSKLAAGSDTQILTLAGGVPTWAALSGVVTSVSGTSNRITSSGGATPVIDIAATYVGQTSITTLGTVTTGTWTATAVDATHGGTNQTTWTTGDLLYASGSNTLAKLGIGSTGNVLTVAAGVPSWAAPAGGGITWTNVTGTSQAMAINSGYVASNASLVTLTLPSTAAVGSVIQVMGAGAGLWKIAQNASQLIRFGNVTTTTGTGGSLSAQLQFDAVQLVCIVADTTWSTFAPSATLAYV